MKDMHVYVYSILSILRFIFKLHLSTLRFPCMLNFEQLKYTKWKCFYIHKQVYISYETNLKLSIHIKQVGRANAFLSLYKREKCNNNPLNFKEQFVLNNLLYSKQKIYYFYYRRSTYNCPYVKVFTIKLMRNDTALFRLHFCTREI